MLSKTVFLISDEFDAYLTESGGVFSVQIDLCNIPSGTSFETLSGPDFIKFTKDTEYLNSRIIEFVERLSQDLKFTWVISNWRSIGNL